MRFRGRALSEMFSRRVVSGIPELDNELDFYCLDESAFKSFFLNEKRRDEIRFLLAQDVIKIVFTPRDLSVFIGVNYEGDFLETDKIDEARFLTPVLDSIVKLAAL